jgi:hypothetical protein
MVGVLGLVDQFCSWVSLASWAGMKEKNLDWAARRVGSKRSSWAEIKIGVQGKIEIGFRI